MPGMPVAALHANRDVHIAAANIELTREELDRFAYDSHLRAGQAREAGRFAGQIMSVTVPTEDGQTATFSNDEGIRMPPSLERIRWWEALGNVKWAIICARQAHDHLSGARPSSELASLGRRICEPEWDLLQLVPIEGE